jgi:eukaryotic-like serine/threonine-protein kinase
MATGQKAFAGNSQASLIAAILEHEPPPISGLQPLSPPALDRVIRKCLAKDADQRWQTAHDLTDELKWMAKTGSQTAAAVPTPTRPKGRERLAWTLLTLTALAALVLAVFHFREAPPVARPIRFSVSPPQKASFEEQLSISPDGERLALIVSTPRSQPSLWVRRLDSLAAQPLPGTDGASGPFWSPDSRFIAFFTQGKLKKIDASGGPPQTLCDAPDGERGTWNRKGTIVFAQDRVLYRVPADSGQATPVTAPDPSGHEYAHLYPHFLPDDRHFLYLAVNYTRENDAIYVSSLDSRDVKRLLGSHWMPAYARARSGPGYLLFLREGALMAQPFDANSLQLTGEPASVADRIMELEANPNAPAFFSVSANGVLAYQTGNTANTQLVWFDRAGKRLGTVELPGEKLVPRLSPDGTQLALEHRDQQTGNLAIWLVELARGATSRFTFEAHHNYAPVWSPDGSRIVFASIRGGSANLYQKVSSGAVDEELLLKWGEGFSYPTDWSRDGRFIAYTSQNAKTQLDLWVLPLEGDRKPVPFLQTQFNEMHGRFSPDGRWMAYTSDESGKWEVYARTFSPGRVAGGQWPISTQGGIHPIWRGDGKELFYISADRRLMAVEVKARELKGRPIFEPGVPKALFDTGMKFSRILPYAVSADGQRFLVVTQPSEEDPHPITVVLNWAAELRR